MIEQYRLLSGDEVIAVHLGRDEVTPDIDGLFRPMDEVLVEARAMAAEYGLDPEWINSRAFSFMEFCRATTRTRSTPRSTDGPSSLRRSDVSWP